MNCCIIVGASKSSQKEFSYDDSDFIIAADAGLAYLKEHHYRVDLTIGDFDSLHYVPEEKNMVRLNVIKDVTDTHVAFEEGMKRGYRKFQVYGCFGGRVEHSFAIIQDAYHYASCGADITIYSENQQITFLINSSMEVEKESGFISVFAYGEAKGVTLKNLKYEVENVTLRDDFPLGVSNEFINKKAVLSVKEGCLVIVY